MKLSSIIIASGLVMMATAVTLSEYNRYLARHARDDAVPRAAVPYISLEDELNDAYADTCSLIKLGTATHIQWLSTHPRPDTRDGLWDRDRQAHYRQHISFIARDGKQALKAILNAHAEAGTADVSGRLVFIQLCLDIDALVEQAQSLVYPAYAEAWKGGSS